MSADEILLDLDRELGPEASVVSGPRALELVRVPRDETLRAWDAADLHVLRHLQLLARRPDTPVLLVNDAFGALACALANSERVVWSDSELARRALRANEARNSIDHPAGWRFADVEPEGVFDVAVVKVPREKALLDHQLALLRPHLHARSMVVGAGMTRHVHTRTIVAFERWIGPSPTTKAWRRSRLILSTVEAPLASPPEPARFEGPRPGLYCVAHAGVFSQRRLDAGSALLLEAFESLRVPDSCRTVADLGCGCGVLAAVAALRLPEATVIAADESALAVRSARETFAASGLRNGRFLRTDGLDHQLDRSIDLILSNPPQHQSAALSQTLLERAIEETHRTLAESGRALMVANRHVNLNVALAQHFHRVRIVRQDRRFMVCEAGRPR